LKAKILRGANEIGGTCLRVSTEKTTIYLDIGESLTGEKLVLEKEKVDGVLVSHGHQDHYGEIDLLPDASVYSGKDTKTMIDVTRLFTGKPPIKNDWHFFENRKPFLIGDIEVTPYLIDHSAYDSYMFLVKAEGKSILYTGDFRLCGRKAAFSKRQIESMPKGIDLLVCEGTTLLREDAPASEHEIEERLVEVFKSNKPIFINVSAQNIDRVVSITRACIRTRKTFVIDLYAAYVLAQLGNPKIPNANFDCVRVFYPMSITQRIADFSKNILYTYNKKRIGNEELNEKLNSCVMLVRPSMQSDLKIRLQNIEGAIFIHSMWDGYWKAEKNDVFRKFVENKKMDIKQIHTSGHVYKDDIKWIIETVKPKNVMPIHTESARDFEGLAENIVYNEF
jgi:ribonuclease J